jgi:hypothetical protein
MFFPMHVLAPAPNLIHGPVSEFTRRSCDWKTYGDEALIQLGPLGRIKPSFWTKLVRILPEDVLVPVNHPWVHTYFRLQTVSVVIHSHSPRILLITYPSGKVESRNHSTS